MILAVPYKEGHIDGHFGHCKSFMLYTIEHSALIEERLIENTAHGHDAVVSVLLENQVQVVICHGLGDGARIALEEAGICLMRGASGEARAQVQAYLEGTLTDRPTGCAHKKVQLGKK